MLRTVSRGKFPTWIRKSLKKANRTFNSIKNRFDVNNPWQLKVETTTSFNITGKPQ